MNNYTEEQILDITTREKEVLAFLKEKRMCPAANVSKVNVGEDIFADKIEPFVRDIKYIKKGNGYVEDKVKKNVTK